jgi:hypothetical protein
MSTAGLQELSAETKLPGSEGRYERFKTTTQFDHPYHREQHEV